MIQSGKKEGKTIKHVFLLVSVVVVVVFQGQGKAVKKGVKWNNERERDTDFERALCLRIGSDDFGSTLVGCVVPGQLVVP